MMGGSNDIFFKNVSFGYEKGCEIISDFSFCFESSGRYFLRGDSGSGKTTLLRLVLGLIKPVSGCICLNNNSVRYSAVFQEDRLLNNLNVLENASIASSEEAARDMLVRLGLADQLNSFPDDLSGGMKRRVALARALSRDFDVLVLDEALTGLDDASKKMCLDLIDEAMDNKQDSILIMASHDISEAVSLGTSSQIGAYIVQSSLWKQ